MYNEIQRTSFVIQSLTKINVTRRDARVLLRSTSTRFTKTPWRN